MENPKPAPGFFAEGRKIFGADPQDTTYVCDTVEDIKFAHADGSRVIAVTYGWHTRDMLEAASPGEIVDSHRELLYELGKL